MNQHHDAFKLDTRQPPLRLADLDTAHQLLADDPEWDRWLDQMAEAEDERHARSDWTGPNW